MSDPATSAGCPGTERQVASVNERVHDQHAGLTWEETVERILAQATALLAQRGDEEAVALLVDVQSVAIDSTGEVMRTR
jgi:hypothetical protein